MMRAVCDNMGAISGSYYLQLWAGGRAGHQAGIGLIVLANGTSGHCWWY